MSEGVRSSLTCPLVAQGKRVGFIFFSSNRPDTYEERHVELFSLIAGHVSFTIEKARLYADLVRAKPELAEMNQTLSRVATLDGLTGIPNRRAMEELLANAWRRAARRSPRSDSRTPLRVTSISLLLAAARRATRAANPPLLPLNWV